jgi:Ni,Fe-hydrogenase III large subunit/Ni,Fe-hydrogenase III component G
MTHVEIIKKYLPEGVATTSHDRTIVASVSHETLPEIALLLSRHHDLPVTTVFAVDDRAVDETFQIYYVFGVPKEDYFIALRLALTGTTKFPSLGGICQAATLYEGRIQELFGLTPVGRPSEAQPTLLHDNWPREVHPMRKDFSLNDGKKKKGDEGMHYEFAQIEGEGIYEIPVGPVHAGIIEPGHFRFSMAGEEILNLEAKLGWMHKGSEKLFETLPLVDQVRLSERIAGDTSFAHATAFCGALEKLAGITVPERANYLRVVFGELERLANHFNDIGFIMFDTGFNFGGSQLTRLRERVMQHAENLTGSRFSRGVNMVGGVTRDIDKKAAAILLSDLEKLERDMEETLTITAKSSVFDNRVSGTGTLAHMAAKDHGAVGVPARASGLAVDARADHPYAAYRALAVLPEVETSGDVEARFTVRVREVRASMRILREALEKMPQGDIQAKITTLTLEKNACVVAVAEGWRGEIAYALLTDSAGKIKRVSVRDPSFINWHLPPQAAPGNLILDFPLINKSFNLSYTGSDT